jgi:hypothetical protein
MTQKLNILLNLTAYSDATYSNSSFKTNKSYVGIDCSNAKSDSFQLNPLETKVIHNGIVSLLADNTTTFDLSIAPSGQYVLSYNSGTNPVFRTKRALSADATTSFIVSRNANVTTYTYSVGTAPSFTSVAIGDTLKIDAPFNIGNRGYYVVIAKTSTSVSVVNYSGAPETVVLGSGFAQNFKIYSSGPLYVGNTVNIKTGFSLVTLGSYVAEIIEDDRIYFSAQNLPLETNIQANIDAYSASKTMIYLETSEEITATINGVDVKIKPVVLGSSLVPGVFLLNGQVYSLSVSNNGVAVASVFSSSVEA